MQPASDAQLLRDYAERGVEAAFTELVHRHTNLVYSAAWRQTGSADIAAEISQAVFIGLARTAKDLAPRFSAEASLAGWLCRSARNLSLNHRRDEFRRQTRERHAMEQFILTSGDALDWERLHRVLDDAMAELGEADHDALVLRFFQNQDFRTIGTAIGVSDDTAQKRVARALDKLRELLAQRGIQTTATALSAAIATNAVQSAPAGLAATISSAALLNGTAATTSTLIATTKTIAMTTIQKTLIAASVALAIGVGILEMHRSAQLHKQNEALQEQQGRLSLRLQQLQQERDDAMNRLNSMAEGVAINKGDALELLKLRHEVGELRRQSDLQQANPYQPSDAKSKAQNLRVGGFIPVSQFANVGFRTPEAALQTYLSASISGTFEQMLAALPPEHQSAMDTLENRELFEVQKTNASTQYRLEGIQIIAKKTVAEDKVDLEVIMFLAGKAPDISIDHFVKSGTEWRYSSSASADSFWGERGGKTETFVPFSNH